MSAQTTNPAILAAEASVAEKAPAVTADPNRPVYHFRPPCCWMNDPNGTIYHEGWYHLFYQFNPYGDLSGYLHWGHTRSRDLVHWEHLPPAVWPSYDLGEEHCWSGCAAISDQGKPMLFYTSVGPEGSRPFEQWAAVSDDDFFTWRKHAANPILALGKQGVPQFEADWRDPFIFSTQNRRFMVLGAADADRANVLLFETQDPDLVAWKYRGILFAQPRSDLRFCECPNFIPLGDKFVLLLSPYANVEYRIGAFDPDIPAFTPESHGILDHGVGRLDHLGRLSESASQANYYATNILFDDQGQCILLAWVRGFQAEQGWSGCLALPRVLTLGSDGLPRQRPLPALQQLRDELLMVETSVALTDTRQPLSAQGDTLEIMVHLEPHAGSTAGILIRSTVDGSRGIPLNYDGQTLRVHETLVPLASKGGVDLHVFLDRSVMEVFVNDGEHAVTQIIYPPHTDQHIHLVAEEGASLFSNLRIWRLSSIDLP